jgi:glycosyltransferase involved in cell wall biosynthesis
MACPKPLRIGLISYRSNPHCGGQGVYVKNLSRALTDLGHHVTVISGPPELALDADIPLQRLPCLDLYNPENPFRVPSLRELADPVNLIEWIGVATTGFPEPFTFGLRAYRFLRRRLGDFDVIHDNQSLSYGIALIARRVPTVATIHHPISVDRAVAIHSAQGFPQKLKSLRWHSFIGMQRRVAPRFARIITVSRHSRRDIAREFKVPADRFRVIPNGISTRQFHPLPGVERAPNRLIVTNSADIPLKGLRFLLEAVAAIAPKHPIRLVVVGTPNENGAVAELIRRLGIAERVHFTGRIADAEYVRQYARATLAVVPSVYEGFGLPVGEAMACGVPVISTTGGGLPEVVGDAGILVPPADPLALAQAITALLKDPRRARALGEAGYRRVQAVFTWERAAAQTAAVYREVIDAHGRL